MWPLGVSESHNPLNWIGQTEALPVTQAQFSPLHGVWHSELLLWAWIISSTSLPENWNSYFSQTSLATLAVFIYRTFPVFLNSVTEAWVTLSLIPCVILLNNILKCILVTPLCISASLGLRSLFKWILGRHHTCRLLHPFLAESWLGLPIHYQ